MAKRKLNQTTRSRRVLYYLLAGFLILALGYYLIPRQSAQVFEVTESLPYGDTTVSGVLNKDTAIGQEGNYFLLVSGQPPVLIDIAYDIDALVGQMVQVSGYLSPRQTSGQPDTIQVDTIAPITTQ